MAAKIVQEAIEKYRSEHLSFFPIPARSKKAAIEWKCYQSRVPNDKEVIDWKANGTANLAIVCGAVSGNLVVLDFDSHDKFLAYCTLLQDKYDIDLFTYTRVVTTARGNHIYFKLPQAIKSAKFPQLDVKSEGGYVMAPPSIHPDGSEYKCSNPDIPIRQINDLKDVGIDVNQVTEADQVVAGDAGEIIPPGSQDAWLYSRACSYRAKGDDATLIIEKLRIDIKRCPPDPGKRPYNDGDFKRIADSACKHPAGPLSNGNRNSHSYNTYFNEGGYRGGYLSAEANPLNNVTNVKERYNSLKNVKVTSEIIKTYLVESGGQWLYTRDLDSDLNVRDTEDKNLRRQVIFQLVKSGLVEKDAQLNNKIRYVNATTDKIVLSKDSLTGCLPIAYPFQIQNKVDIFSRNIIAIAGTMNAGKTAFNLNVARMNKDKFKIVYFSSEMAQQELTSRVMNFGDDLTEWESVDFRERGHDFVDVIRPDWFNIIDYVEINENMYQIGALLENIYRKLTTGIAMVSIQKKVGALFGRGQEFSAEKPRLYLSMDDGKLTIVKGKNWHTKTENPKGQFVNFKLVNGCEFIQQGNWKYNDELGGE